MKERTDRFSILSGNLFLLLLSLVFVWLLLEGYARFFGAPIIIDVRGRYGVDLFQHDPLLGFRLRPDMNVHPLEAEDGAVVITNSLGYRSPERPEAKPAGTRRIVLLGDSYGYGLGLPYEHTMAAFLEEELPQTEVINLSVPGFNTTQELLAWQRDGVRFDPDLVILLYCPNDLRGNITMYAKHNRLPYYLIDENDSLELHGVPVPKEKLEPPGKWPSVLQRLLNNSAGYRLIRFRLSLIFGRVGKGETLDRVVEWRKAVPLTTSFSEGEKLTLRLVQEIGKTADKRGVPVLVCSTILKSQARENAPRSMEERIAGLAASDPRLIWLDLIAPFQRKAAKTDLWIPSNGHWNREGNRLAARCVSQEIEKRRLLPAASEGERNSGPPSGE